MTPGRGFGGLSGRPGAGRRHARQALRYRQKSAGTDEITLWFNSCLYDMMLLGQFLCFAREELRQTRVWLVCEELRSDGSRFAGYAELDERKTMLDRRRSLTEPMMRDALESWRAFTSATSEAWRGLARREHQLAPFLAPAARRLLEQLPDESGLNRLEMEIMTALAAGGTQLPRLFEAVSAAEDRPFFGEAVVWQALNRLATDALPAVTLHGPAALIPVNVYPLPGVPEFHVDAWRVVITPAGRRSLESGGVFSGARNRERWVANVHLCPGN